MCRGDPYHEAMEYRSFLHDPNICFPIVRRRVGEFMAEFFLWYGEMTLTNAKSMWEPAFNSRQAYHGAVQRLRRSGVVAYLSEYDKEPVLRLTSEARDCTRDSFRPERCWSRRWNGLWYVLVYDIPESNRRFRDGLRNFLRKNRMGCLQRSVYVTPHDIRPEYDDLVHALNVQYDSYLFEASTVLGRDAQDIVLSAWDFRRLDDAHLWYCDLCEHNEMVLWQDDITANLIGTVAREELTAYTSVMDMDPLLPRELLPREYRGSRVWKTHKAFIETVKTRLKQIS